MVVMTDGLRTLAGSAIRNALLRFTRTPTRGAVTGAVSTAILQSSSVTTVAAVGFVGASLMSFPEALGIVFGANVGTTITGWLVATLGFKLKLGTVVLPVIFLGVLLRLFGKGRTAAVGYAVAGFGVIFVGITVMQEGMASMEGLVTPDTFPDDTWSGRLQLILIGILVTLITQSSSAGVATTLTLLYAGSIEFHQAAAMVIGMDVGTTIKALLATIGASVGARRTGYSHVIYNIMTGSIALFLIDPFVWAWESISTGSLVANAEIALVAFHTTFNTLGVLVALPFTRRFANLIERLVPEKLPGYARKLDMQLMQQPGLALSEAQTVIARQLKVLLLHLQAILYGNGAGHKVNLRELQAAIDEVHAYIDKIKLSDEKSAEWGRLIELIHTLDHMQRLHERCEEDEYRADIARVADELQDCRQLLLSSIAVFLESIDVGNWTSVVDKTSEIAREIESDHDAYRHFIMEKTGRGELDVRQATRLLEARRWMLRVSRHVAHISKHLAGATLAAGSQD